MDDFQFLGAVGGVFTKDEALRVVRLRKWAKEQALKIGLGEILNHVVLGAHDDRLEDLEALCDPLFTRPKLGT